MIQKTNAPNTKKIMSFFNNQQIAKLLIEQVNQFYHHQISTQFSMTLISQSNHLYIFFQRNTHKKEPIKNQTDDNGAYAIKITKGFPVQGLRVYILKNSYAPRIFDGRDVCKQILKDDWTYKNRLTDILNGIDYFEKKLRSRNNKPIAMQKTGQFKMGDLFDIQELKKFSALETFQDLTRENGALLGTTQTHFVVFKNSPQIGSKGKFYQIVRACQMQCITDLFQNENNEIIITINKYKKVKQFNQYEKISRKYRIEESEKLIRNILKNIHQFQKTEIILKLNNQIHKNEPSFEKINSKIEEMKLLEQKMFKKLSQDQKNQVQDSLIQNYQSIIEYFSQKTSPYYHIFVAKLNKIYAINASKIIKQQ